MNPGVQIVLRKKKWDIGRSGGAAFSPLSLDKLTYWVDYESANDDGSHKVDSWANKNTTVGGQIAQGTSGSRPILGINFVDFVSGASRFLSHSSELNTLMEDDLQGEIITVCAYPSPSSSGTFHLAFEPNSNKLNVAGINASSNKLKMTANNAERAYANDLVTVDEAYHIECIGSNGSAYHFNLDGVDGTVIGSPDDGWWFGDQAGATRTFNLGKTPIANSYGVSRMKEQLYFNELLTDDERASVISFLQTKHANAFLPATTVYFYGDSITRGNGLSPITDRWSTLFSKGIGVVEVNNGVDNQSITQSVTPTPVFTISSLVSKTITNSKIFFGWQANDSTYAITAEGSLEAGIVAYLSAYDDLLTEALSKSWLKADIVIVGGWDYNGNPDGDPTTLANFQAFAAAQKQWAIDNDLAYVSDFPTYSRQDHIHPDSEGSRTIALHVLNGLK